MEVVERSDGFEAVPVPFSAPLVSTATIAKTRERIVSLDVMRGFVVIGMIVVNTVAFSNTLYGYHPASQLLSHSAWAGFTFADFVFPAFVFIAGFSVAVSLRHARFEWPVVRRIGVRTIILFALGLLLGNITWLSQAGEWRLFGVLQRIGLCYLATALLFVSCGPRSRIVLSLSLLVLYWPLTLLPVPDEATNLLAPGANFVSWTDRVVLGAHALVTGPRGYDPEGLLSTLPAIAQCLLGASFGEWLLKRRGRNDALPKLAAAGAVALLLGLLWSPYFPIVKNLWTSSFVLVSSGLSALVLCTFHWMLDEKKLRLRGSAFLGAFGANALFAYVIQESAQLLPAADDMHAIGRVSLKIDTSGLVAALPAVAFILILWAPLEFMRRRRWIVKL